ncbi:MAG: CPBP family intramembrane metalloprotease [Phycisphaerales bacterium]|nr:CPBP family intramembrane metalloprotease [Phycisphaerales bacterium]
MTDDGRSNQGEPGRAAREPEPPPLLMPAAESAAVPPTVRPPAPPPPPRPRVFSAVIAPVVAIPTTIIVASVALLVPAFILHWNEISRARADEDVIERVIMEFIASPAGLLLSLIPAELTYFALVILAVRFSPQAWRDRLAMHRPATAWWAYLLFALAAPACGMLGGLLAALLGRDESSSLEMLFEGLQNVPASLAVIVVVLYSVLPGLCEEMLYRGYIQSRLLRHWPPILAILFASAAFAAAHVEPTHAIAVFPLGVWLGVIAWRCGSIWPSILTHALNNAYGVTMMMLVTPDEAAKMEQQWTIGAVMVIVVSGAAMIGACVYLFRRPAPDLSAAQA